MRAYVAVRGAEPQALGYRRDPADSPPALGYDRTGHAYAGVAAARRPAPVWTGLLGWVPVVGGGLAVGALAAICGLVLIGLVSGRGTGSHYSSYRPAGIGGVLNFIAANTQAALAPLKAAPAAAAASVPAVDGGDRPAVAPPRPDHALIAPPSVSAAQIDQVLQQYGSPAAGQGAAFYDLGVQYGIDPAYALAFFIHESSAGTKGVARFTNSIGNIRTTPGYRDYQGYRAYDTWAAGLDDWYKLIKTLYVEGWGKATVAQIIPTYAPSGDSNDPPTYIANVTQLVDSWQQK